MACIGILMISIHAPHAGSDLRLFPAISAVFLFQSTLPMRGATWTFHYSAQMSNFNPRSPCGERPYGDYKRCKTFAISIHAPHAGSDIREFYGMKAIVISIHAPHAGSDPRCIQDIQLPIISIHAPHAGSDRPRRARQRQKPLFQSTLPMRGATRPESSWHRSARISIHAPHAGSDPAHYGLGQQRRDFNPRSPCGERLFSSPASFHIPDFNPRSPCGERLWWQLCTAIPLAFQSTLPMRGATGLCIYIC